MSSNCQYKCALLPQGLKENSSSESYPSRTFMDLFVFLIKQRGITKTQLCDSHDRELRGDLHELRRSSNATQRHLLHRDVVEVQARLAHGDIHSLISQSAERRQKRFVLRAHQEGSLVGKVPSLTKNKSLGSTSCFARFPRKPRISFLPSSLSSPICLRVNRYTVFPIGIRNDLYTKLFLPISTLLPPFQNEITHHQVLQMDSILNSNGSSKTKQFH